MLNALGGSNNTNNNYQDQIPERKNELPDEKTNPALDIFRFNNDIPMQTENREEVKEEMNENMIDPSRLQPASSLYNRNEEIQTIKQETSFVNLDQVKSSAQDINQEKKPAANMDELLHNENPEKENKFFVGLENNIPNSDTENFENMAVEEQKDEVVNSIPIEDLEDNISSNAELSEKEPPVEESTKTDENKEQIDVFDIESSKIDFSKAKEELGKTIVQLKEKGLKIYKEEADFGNTVQIIIRIDK